MLAIARLLAVIVGAGLAIGEGIRSWGVSRPWYTVADDFLMGAFLIVAALRANRPGGSAWLAGAFGVASGVLYSSLVLHLSVWDKPDPGNIPQKVLTMLIGLALAGSLLGLIMVLWISRRRGSG